MAFRRLSSAIVLAAGILLAVAPARLAGLSPADLPTRLTDQEFWKLSDEFSEPSGYFQSDNLLSNETVFARAVPDLVARTKPGGVYLGVGPEQNFTYIAAMKPKMAFITDIRRGNLHTQLMYKALFELSADRAEFVSRLFTKPRPTGLTAAASARELMDAYWDVYTSDERTFDANLKAVHDQLTVRHKLPLSADDLAGVASVYRAFYWYGPGITWAARTNLSSPPTANNVAGTYRGMMIQADSNGTEFSYLSSDERFAAVKDLESRNLIVPVVGNFAGPKALRAVGAYIKDHGAVVSAFYLSNVESYLRRDGSWVNFCNNVATFPLDASSVFIRPSGSGLPMRGTNFVVLPPPGSVGGSTTGMVTITTNGSGTVPIRYITVSGTNSSRSALDPIAEEVKSCTGTTAAK